MKVTWHIKKDHWMKVQDSVSHAVVNMYSVSLLLKRDLKYPNANYLDLSAQQRQQLIQDDPSLQQWVSPSYEGAPEYMYAALFDSNACFDGLRRKLLSIGDHAAMLNTASMLLELHHRHQMNDNGIIELANNLKDDFHIQDAQPQDSFIQA